MEDKLRFMVITMGKKRWVKSNLAMMATVSSRDINKFLEILINRKLVTFIPNVKQRSKPFNKRIKGFYELSDQGKRARTNYINGKDAMRTVGGSTLTNSEKNSQRTKYRPGMEQNEVANVILEAIPYDYKISAKLIKDVSGVPHSPQQIIIIIQCFHGRTVDTLRVKRGIRFMRKQK